MKKQWKHLDIVDLVKPIARIEDEVSSPENRGKEIINWWAGT